MHLFPRARWAHAYPPLAVAFAVALGPTDAFGQTYAVRDRAEPYVTLDNIPGITNIVRYWSSPFSVTLTRNQNIGFDFQWGGQTYTQYGVSVKGFIGLENMGSPPGSGVPNNEPTNRDTTFGPILAPFWDDHRLVVARTGIVGSAPQRIRVIQWEEWTGSGTGQFQIWLYEERSRADFRYGGMVSGPNSATMGFLGRPGEPRGAVRPCADTANCTPADFNALSGRAVSIDADRGPDLVALGITAPQFATLGVPVRIPVRIGNDHRNALGPFDVAIFASRTPEREGAEEIGRAQVALPGFTERDLEVEATPGPELGENSYWLFVEMNPERSLNEVEFDNNVAQSETRVRLLPPQPNLQVSRVDFSPRQVTAGQTVELQVTVQNAGSLPVTGVPVSFLLSTNPVITPTDRELRRQNVSLTPGQSRTLNQTVTIPEATNSGTYYLGAFMDPDADVAEVSKANNGLASFNTLEVLGGSVGVLTRVLPEARLGETYVALLVGAGGSGAYRWEITQGMLPRGLGIVAATGEFFGRPSELGCEAITVRMTDQEDETETATQPLELCVSERSQPLTIVTRQVPEAVAGREYGFQLVATGGAEAGERTWTAEGLPTGLNITPGGLLFGAPDEASSGSFTAEVGDGDGTATRELEFRILPEGALQIRLRPLPLARVGERFQHQFEVAGGLEPITWDTNLGRLRELGLDLSADGVLSGVPTQVGRFRIAIAATDAAPMGRQATDEKTFDLIIGDDERLQFLTETLPAATIDQGFDRAIAAVGGLPPYTWSLLSGRLPEGLSGAENPATSEYRIVGTPTRVETQNLLFEVRDQEGRAVQRVFVLDIAEAPPPPAVDPGGCATTGAQASNLILAFALFGLTRRRIRS